MSKTKKLLHEITSIDAKNQFYKDVDSELYRKIIEIDPLYSKEKDILGVYSKWLLNKKNLVMLKSFYKVDFNDLENNLLLFDDNKKKLKNIDINQYLVTQLPDLVKDLSGRVSSIKQEKSAEYFNNTDFDGEVDKYSVGNYYIFQPKTKRASNYYAKNSNWCTLANSDFSSTSWEYYTEKGKLWILIDKSNSNVKYQLLFETEDFRDMDDKSVLLSKVLNKDTVKFFIEQGYTEKYFYNFIISDYKEFIYELDFDRCDKVQIIKILNIHPDLLDKFNVSDFNESEIIDLVIEQPKLVKLLKTIDFYVLDDDDKIKLIIKFGNKDFGFNLNELDKESVCELLKIQPIYYNEIDKTKINEFDEYDIVEVLKVQPQFVDKLNISILRKNAISALLKEQPQLKKYFVETMNERIKTIIKEELNNLEEGITSGQSIVWARTGKNAIQSIQKKGYMIGNRNVFGYGVYACTDFDTQLDKHHREQYGNVIVECKIKSLDKFIILYPEDAKKIYGEKWRIKQQIEYIMGRDLYIKHKIDKKLSDKIAKEIDNGKYAGKEFRDFYESFFSEFCMGNTKGIVYYTAFDGKAIACYEENNIQPLQYTEDEGNTWTPMVNQNVYARNKKGELPNKMTTDDIIKIIIKNPKSINRFDFKEFTKLQIITLLQSRPELDVNFDLTNFNFYDVLTLCKKQLKFKSLLDKMDFSKLDKGRIVSLLLITPDLYSRADLTKLNNFDITEVIGENPELIDVLDLTKLTDENISTLIMKHSFLLPKLDITKLKQHHITDITNKYPDLNKYFKKEDKPSIMSSIKNMFKKKTNESLLKIIKEEFIKLNK